MEKIALKSLLLDLKDPSFPLLKKLRQKAPGTYIHSVLVSELATTASLRFLKSDPLLTQIGGLYHDIGKMVEPYAYAENQEDKEYPFLPEIILTHVQKSVELAEAFSLPKEIQRFMQTHHGSQNAPHEDPDQKNPYPGSFRPQSIEETLVMLADSCEAAIRSARKIERDIIRKIIESIFQQKIQNDQLKESVLTSYDLNQIQEDFLEVFFAIHHRRHALEKE
jgi:putative nucleotidyltransferase with HDIG domain